MPQIAQSFTVPFPRDQVWRFFHDPAQVAACMPGASLTGPPEGGKLTGEMRVKLGPITAAFAGEAELAMDDANWSGSIRGQGTDRKNNSRAKSDVSFSALEQPGGTQVDVKVDFTLTGVLAQFSRGAIVQEIARRLTDEFARNLAARMEALAPTAHADLSDASAPAASAPEAAPPPPPARHLNIGALLWSIILGWIRRVLDVASGTKPGGREP